MTLEPLDLAQVDLRAEPDALPFDAPATNTVSSWKGRDVLWLGPDEWLVVGDAGTESAIVDEIESALAERHRSIVDVSANRIAFDLTDGLERLANACGLDLHPVHWMPGMCAQTLFGQAQLILQQRDERTTRVFVRPSFVGYVEQLLETA
jgi:sarcosine oxidase subunit gamma